ncbi:hypothetical protein Syun_031133 [Stephania yunnanensis]|uniref:Uncharacterized protein n=1 Tax=Stephania yunnanensis TaxID=152371 RepID=A0AAP0E208_9MAGN
MTDRATIVINGLLRKLDRMESEKRLQDEFNRRRKLNGCAAKNKSLTLTPCTVNSRPIGCAGSKLRETTALPRAVEAGWTARETETEMYTRERESTAKKTNQEGEGESTTARPQERTAKKTNQLGGGESTTATAREEPRE